MSLNLSPLAPDNLHPMSEFVSFEKVFRQYLGDLDLELIPDQHVRGEARRLAEIVLENFLFHNYLESPDYGTRDNPATGEFLPPELVEFYDKALPGWRPTEEQHARQREALAKTPKVDE